MKTYYVYMLRCDDNSVYTGFTTDVARRFQEHISKDKPYGKYTRTHTPVKIESIWSCDSKSKACSLEYNIKKLNKIQKERLISRSCELNEYFESRLNCSDFLRLNPNSLIKECEKNG